MTRSVGLPIGSSSSKIISAFLSNFFILAIKSVTLMVFSLESAAVCPAQMAMASLPRVRVAQRLQVAKRLELRHHRAAFLAERVRDS